MKYTYKLVSIIIFLLFISIEIKSQSNRPNKEFFLTFPDDIIKVKRGDSTLFQGVLLKAKNYKKSKAKLSLISPLPYGVQIIFNENEVVCEQIFGKIVVSKDASPSIITLVISAQILYLGSYLNKGNTITIEII